MALELYHFAFFLNKKISTPFGDAQLLSLDKETDRLKVRQVDVGINDWYAPANVVKPYLRPTNELTDSDQKILSGYIKDLIHSEMDLNSIRAHEILWLLQHDYDPLKWLKSGNALYLNSN